MMQTVWNTAFYSPPKAERGKNINRHVLLEVIRQGANTVYKMSAATGFSPESLRRHLYSMTDLGLLKCTRSPGLHTKWEAV